MTYLLMLGKYPFNGKTATELYNNIEKGKIDFSDEHWKGRNTAVDFIT